MTTVLDDAAAPVLVPSEGRTLAYHDSPLLVAVEGRVSPVWLL